MNPDSLDFLGGLFDFNGDGKTDAGEMFIAYKIFEEVTKGSDDVPDDPTCFHTWASGTIASILEPTQNI